MGNKEWRVFNLAQIQQEQMEGKPVEYLEFLKVPSLSCGIYKVSAGSKDMQGSHDEDEIYYVLEGKAQLRVGDATELVGPGSVLYVQASAQHSFFEIEEDMTLLVFFASQAPGFR